MGETLRDGRSPEAQASQIRELESRFSAAFEPLLQSYSNSVPFSRVASTDSLVQRGVRSVLEAKGGFHECLYGTPEGARGSTEGGLADRSGDAHDLGGGATVLGGAGAVASGSGGAVAGRDGRAAHSTLSGPATLPLPSETMRIGSMRSVSLDTTAASSNQSILARALRYTCWHLGASGSLAPETLAVKYFDRSTVWPGRKHLIR